MKKSKGNGKASPPYDEIVRLYNSILGPLLPEVHKVNKDRKAKIKARWNEVQSLEKFKEIFNRVASAPFLLGEGAKGWKANFDWIMKNGTNYVKVLEGVYDNGPRGSPNGRDSPGDNSWDYEEFLDK